MRSDPDPLFHGWPRARRWVLLLAVLLVAGMVPARAQIDAGINQTVWKMLYNVSDAQINDPVWLAADDDGDGLSNGAELAAGTNPFNPTATLAVTAMASAATGPSFTFPTVAGKQYFLQSTANLADPGGWTSPSSAFATGNGLPQTLLAPPPTPNADGSLPTLFYRVVVQDTDTDGDGISDWAEKITGFDPTTAHTHGATQDDHTALAADLAQENVVTVTAAKSTATQPATAATAVTDTASLTITRGGTLHFSTITVPLTWSGTAVAGIDYAPLPTTVTFPPKVGSITLTVLPLANPARLTGATITLSPLPGGGYSVGASHCSASAVINPAGLTNGSGLSASYYNTTSQLYSKYGPALFATPVLSRVDPTVDLIWTTGAGAAGSPGAGVNATYFTARWQGQVQPQYSETYYFVVNSDDGYKLWVNGQLLMDQWSYISGDHTASIALQAGVLYDIRLDYYQATGPDFMHLSWYSNSQTKQIIPSSRLYPLTNTPAPPAITSPATAFGFVNQPFSFPVTASTSGGAAPTYALGAGSGPLPNGLMLNPATGLISGTPTVAGDFPVALTATNAYGTGASVLDIQVLNPGSGVTRELWQNLPGPNLSNLPLAATPDHTDTTLTTLEDNTNYAANTGERLRGYFVAPTTGNYYFWLAADNNAEFWLSDDAEPVNLIRRAVVAAPGTAAESWNASGQTRQRTPWLALAAGQKYYYEVRRNTGADTSNNLAVGWLQDPTGLATSPAATGAVVPGYVLYPFDYPTATAAAGVLYVTNLSPQGIAASTATGSANLRMLPGNAQAILYFNYSGLSSPRTAYHIHIAPDSTGSGPIVFDLDDVDKFHPELKTADGGYIWNIINVGAYTAAQIVTAIQNGTTYFNVHTVNYPGGEIRGFLTLVNGSQTAPAPVPDPGYADDSAADAGAARFLNQAAFGASPADLAAVKAGGYSAWIDAQQALPATHLLPSVLAQAAMLPSNPFSSVTFDNAWWSAAVTGPDQLRQRVAFALSEIMVVSDSTFQLGAHSDGLGSYYDALSDGAFGNFRDLLKTVTLHPAMGVWLNMQGNSVGSLALGRHANENYAREVLQLFSVGLNRLWPDGSLVLDSGGSLVPTYTQDTITNGFARVFTGWTWHQALQSGGQLPTAFYPASDYTDPMTMVKGYHDLGPKNLLDNVVLPPAAGYSATAAAVTGSQADTRTTAYDSYSLADLDSALDNIFNHPNVGPYVCRQLIQRLVESNPSPAYLGRVVAKFNDDGTAAHVRGNLGAVVRAILLDGEARDAVAAAASTTAGKQREPLMRITGPARTFLFASNSGQYQQSGGTVMTITTSSPHRFSVNDVVSLDFSVNNTGTPAVAPAGNPSSGGYVVLSAPAPTANTFAVHAANYVSAYFSQPANSGTITVSAPGPGAGENLYLEFPAGNANPNGLYPIVSTPTTSTFTVAATGTPPTKDTTGYLLMPRVTGYYTITAATAPAVSTITLNTSVSSNVGVGDHIWLQPGSADQITPGDFVVASVIDERHFTVANSSALAAETQFYFTMYPVGKLPLTRSGNVALPSSKFDMANTNAQIVQTPVDSPTVFNFFAPDYRYPGTLAANNITTPEFQLTTDSNIVTLSNTIASTILSSTNTNGLSNFKNGAINFDLGPLIAAYATVSTATTSATVGTKVTTTTTVTTAVDATGLVNKLNNLLTGGMMTPAAKTQLVNFINDPVAFPPTVSASLTGTVSAPPATPPAPATTSARDKVRAVVQAILVSPEYAVQR